MTNLIGGLPAFLSERQVMYRERAASMYAVLPFGIATGVVELPYLIAQALIFVPISYFMIGFRAEAGPLLLYIVIFTESIALYTFMVPPLVSRLHMQPNMHLKPLTTWSTVAFAPAVPNEYAHPRLTRRPRPCSAINGRAPLWSLRMRCAVYEGANV